MNSLKYFVFAVCMGMSISNCFVSVWDHNMNLAGAWFSAFCGWLSTLFANLAKDN